MKFLPVLTEESFYYSLIDFGIPKKIKFRIFKNLLLKVVTYTKTRD